MISTHNRFSSILASYIVRQFFSCLLLVISIVLVTVLFVETLETLRRAYHKAIPFHDLLQLILFRTPHTIQEILPFILLVTSMLTYIQLSRNYEITVMRAAGLSIWQMVIPVLMTALLIGVVNLFIWDPFANLLLHKNEKINNKYFKSAVSAVTVSPTGIWLRDNSVAEHNRIITATHVDHHAMELSRVTFFIFSKENLFIERLEAEQATLTPEGWHLMKVTHYPVMQTEEMLILPTRLAAQQLQESIALPKFLSVWQIPSFIEALRKAGFSVYRYSLYMQRMIATPFLYATMVLLAVPFTFRLPRKGRTMGLFSGGLITGFMFYFILQVTAAFGHSGNIPVIVIAWVPIIIIALCSIALMLHVEYD